MKVTERNRRSGNHGHRPVHFLVTPKFIAMAVMLPCLTIWATPWHSWRVAVRRRESDFTFTATFWASLDSLVLRDIVTDSSRAFHVGITITAVGCLEDCPPEPAPSKSAAPLRARGHVHFLGYCGRPGFSLLCSFL